MIYLIEPTDNFFFRTPVPFEAGGETSAVSSSFPPMPSVYAGAFRMLNKEAVRPRMRIGINGLWLENSFYFPRPLDLYPCRIHEDTYFLKSMRLKKRPMSNYPLDYMPYIPENNLKKEEGWENLYLSEKSLAEYLNNDYLEIEGLKIDDKYIKAEPKIGIEIDSDSGTAKNKQLYQSVSIRPDHGLKLAVEVNSEEMADDQAIIKLGGEGKTARLKKSDYQLDILIQPDESKYFKLYLATPAIFKNGWLPSWIDETTKCGWFKDKKRKITVKLISACIGRKVLCGGFGYDKLENCYRPKEMRYAVPAGSVYYFEILNGSFEDALKLFHKKCISEYRDNMGFDYKMFNRTRYCDRGFGYALVGKQTDDRRS